MTVAPRLETADSFASTEPARRARPRQRVLHEHAERIAAALAACPSLMAQSPEQEALWLTVQTGVCTAGRSSVTPLGSRRPVIVDAEYAGDEIIAAMRWLVDNEQEARALRPLELFVRLRGEATRGRLGSARMAQAEALHGLTNVPPGRPVRFVPLDAEEVV